MTNPFDPYDFRARLQPAFLALVPIAIGVFAWAPAGSKVMTAIWSLLGAAGSTFFLANLSRNRGKKVEPELWHSWGGAPTTQLLRHSGPANPVLRERWHKHLGKLLGRSLPTKDQEAANPSETDAIYEAATRLLIGKVRDRKAYPFVFRDNMNYGFCRNLYSLKALGISATIAGFVASASSGLWHIWCGRIGYLPLVCAAICGCFLLWWIFTVKPDWVKVPAINYAQHLFESTEKPSRARKASADAE